MSFKELRSRCIELGLTPCTGKGITKEVLQKRLDEYDAQNEAKEAETISEGAKEEVKGTKRSNKSEKIKTKEAKETTNSEKRIEKNDKAFYLKVRDIILVPDLRPKDTLEKDEKIKRRDRTSRYMGSSTG